MVNLQRVSSFLSKGWVKALLIALPISVTFGYLALIGFLLGVLDIIEVYFTPNSWHKEMHYLDWWTLISGLCGLLGIAGIWIRLIFQGQLDQSVGRFNWFVCTLLLIGVFGVIWLMFGLGIGLPIDGYQGLLPHSAFFCLTIYGGWLAYTAISPRR